jgi:O-methyltransferase
MKAVEEVPDFKFYERGRFAPWLGYGEFAKYYGLTRRKTLISRDRLWILYSLLQQTLVLDGDVWECGVYMGGSAAMMAGVIADRKVGKKLRLFDTYEGMPEVDPEVDMHHKGDFANTSEESVLRLVGNAEMVVSYKGFIPDTFCGLEDSRLCFAHVDVDIYRSVKDCFEFIFPRLVVGGIMVSDDYGCLGCSGARKAIDEFCSSVGVYPLVLPSKQAIIFKNR